MAVLQHPAKVGPELIRRAVTVQFTEGSLAVVRDAIAASAGAPERTSVDDADWVARVTAEVPARYATLVNQLAVAPIPERSDKLETYCRRIVSDFIDRDLLRLKVALMGAMQRLDAAAEPERYGEVQRELVRIEAERRVIRAE